LSRYYWRRFAKEKQEIIVEIAADLSKLLFVPNLVAPINTLDVPLAGFGYGSHVLPFAFDLVNVANGLALPDSSRKIIPTATAMLPTLSDDTDGSQTIGYMKKAKDLVELLCSKHSGSLGLHPALYFYTPRGEFVPAAFFNLSTWFLDLEKRGKLKDFRDHRQAFEGLILEHPVIAKPALHKLGTGGRSRPRMIALFSRILDLLIAGKSKDDVWATVTGDPDFQFLAADDQEQQKEASYGTPGSAFPRRAKSVGFYRQALPNSLRCPICGGLMHMNGMTTDHDQERSKGGLSADENARSVHPICNSTPGTSRSLLKLA
jgi:hypothetical protein